jgi:endonuclease/exonuclease/phosphatase family metal-dependent hydrolase
MRTTIVHASGRFDRPEKALAADLLRFATSEGASIVTLTEQNNLTQKRRTALRYPGWSWFHADEKGADDCAVLWDSSIWTLDGWARAVPLTNVTWQRVKQYGGGKTPPVHATVAPLRSRVGGRRLVVIAVHMPTRSTALRRRAWASCIRGLAKLVREIRGADSKARIVLAADWNADWKNPKDRALLSAAAKRMGLEPRTSGGNVGTHGQRVIDGVWTDAKANYQIVLAQSPASDHRPVKVVVNA